MRLRWHRQGTGSASLAAPETGPGSATLAARETGAEPRPDELRVEIACLSERNRRTADPVLEERLVSLRHMLGTCLLDSSPTAPGFASPDWDGLPAGPLPELGPAQLTPGLVRAAVLRDGCALVRELVPAQDAERLARAIERAFQARDTPGVDRRYYSEFQPQARFGPVLWRAWIQEGGGLLAADSPAVCFEVSELFESSSIPSLVSGYLGEPGLLSVHKTTLRKADPAVSGAWHQDGAFMGPVRALNLWLVLSRCGDDAPGLDVVPTRLDRFLATGTEDAALTWTISDQGVQNAAPGVGVVRPIFEPGDALLFDEMFVHRTAADRHMIRPRFAVESWFFGGSAFPADYAPLGF